MSYQLPRSTPEKQGVPSEILTELLEELSTFDLMKGIIILRHGHIITESYWKPHHSDQPTALWSLSKSFTSCAIGFAREEKLLSLDDKLISFFPEYAPCITDEKMFKVTLRDLLTMRSGHAQCAFAFAYADTAGDYLRGFFASRLEFEPGTRFAYNSLGTYMLAAVIRRVTGLNVREDLLPRLFDVLEIVPGKWDSCPAGTNYGGFGLHLRTADIARFAQLVLNKGVWNGKQVIPADYLAEALQPHADNSMNDHPDWKCGYGYQFWCSRHGFRGDGACGQYAVILPEEDMAIAVNGAMTNMGRVLELFWEKLLPALKGEPLPENLSAADRLAEVAASRQIHVEPCCCQVQRKNCAFEFFPNAAGIERGEITFTSKECTLSFKTSRGEEKLAAGFGTLAKSTWQLQDFSPHDVASSARWVDEKSLEIRVVHLDSTFRDTWKIVFEEDEIKFDWQTCCSLFRPLMVPLKVRSFKEV